MSEYIEIGDNKFDTSKFRDIKREDIEKLGNKKLLDLFNIIANGDDTADVSEISLFVKKLKNSDENKDNKISTNDFKLFKKNNKALLNNIDINQDMISEIFNISISKANEVSKTQEVSEDNLSDDIDLNSLTKMIDKGRSSDEIKDETIEFIDNEVLNALSMLEGYDAGIISKGYNGIKEFLKSDISKSNVKKLLYLKLETSNLLKRAKEGKLTKKEYFNEIKNTLYVIYPRPEKPSKEFEKQLESRIASLSPEEVERNIDEVLKLPNPKAKDYNEKLTEYLAKFKNQTSEPDTFREVDGKSICIRGGIKQAFKLKDGQDLMTFEEVFKDRFQTEYDTKKYEELVKAKNELTLLSGASATYNQVYNELHSKILTCESLMEPGRGNESVANIQAGYLQGKIVDVLKSLGYEDAQSQNEFLMKATGRTLDIEQEAEGDNKLPFKIPTYDINKVTYVAKQLLAYLKKNAPSQEKLENQAKIVDDRYRSLFGNTDSDAIVNSFIQDSENFVGKVRTGVEIVGAATMVVGMFVCTPLAVAGGVISGAGGVGLEAINEISRKDSSEKKLKELRKELITNAALFAAGAGAAKVGMAAKAALIAENCPRLVACIADVGADVTLSAISNMILTGDLMLEQEGLAQVVSLIAGHIKAGRFKGLGKKTKTEQPPHKPDIPVRNIVNNKNFFNEFIKTGKDYELAVLPDGKYVLRFKDDALNMGNKYTYCILDKDKNLIKKFDGLTPKKANSTILNHMELKFEKHRAKPSQVYVSFDAGIIEKLVSKIKAHLKCKTLMNKVNQLDELLAFYEIKNEDLTVLNDSEINKMIENLEIFETAIKDLSEEQLKQLNKLFRVNPSMTRDLATMDALDIAKKIGVEKLEGGKNIITEIEKTSKKIKQQADEPESGISEEKRNEILAEYRDTIEICHDGTPEFENMLTSFANYVNRQKVNLSDNIIDLEGILWNIYGGLSGNVNVKKVYNSISNLLNKNVSAQKIEKFVNEMAQGKIDKKIIERIDEFNDVLPIFIERNMILSEMNVNQFLMFPKLKPEYQDFCLEHPEFFKQYSNFEIILPDNDMRMMMENFLDMNNMDGPLWSEINNYKRKLGHVEVDEFPEIVKYLDTQCTKEEHLVYRGTGFTFVNSVMIGDKSLGDLLRSCKSQDDCDNLVKILLTREPIENPSFMSTSFDPNVADNFAKNIVWDLTLPKGTKASCIDMCSNKLSDEAEVLVQHHSKLLISHIEKLPDGRYRIKATVVQ